MNNQALANADIRNEIDRSGVKKWEIAAKMNIHQCTFSTWLRFELSDELKAQVRAAIKEIEEEQG